MEHLGLLELLDTPTINGQPVLINAGGVPAIASGDLTARPSAGVVGRLYLDSSSNTWYRDNGATWDNISQVALDINGTTNEITVVDGNPTTISLAANPIVPGLTGMRIPSGATADRNPAAPQGTLRFNTTDADFESYNGSEWLPFGQVLQVQEVNLAPATYTGVQIPLDTSTPTSTEGAQFFTISFTPRSASSRIYVSFSATVGTSTAGRTIIMTVFRGTTIIGSAVSYAASANLGYNISFNKGFAPGSTAPITISGRLGLSGSGNTILNQSGTNTLGGSLASSVTIMEIK